MNRRIDLGNAVTAFVLVAMLVVAAALSPKAKAPPPTPLEMLDSALQATFWPRVTAHLQNHDQVLAIVAWRDSTQQSSADSIARFANAQYHGAAIEAISVEFIGTPMPDAGQRMQMTRSVFLPPLLDGRATPVTIDPRTFQVRKPSTSVIATREDSLIVDPATLRPIEEWHWGPVDTAHVTYDGTHIHGSFDTAFTVAPFAAPELETIIRSLPLAAGYAARFPVYWAHDPDGDLRWESIYVVGADSLCRCWHVSAAGGNPGFRRFEIPLEP